MTWIFALVACKSGVAEDSALPADSPSGDSVEDSAAHDSPSDSPSDSPGDSPDSPAHSGDSVADSADSEPPAEPSLVGAKSRSDARSWVLGAEAAGLAGRSLACEDVDGDGVDDLVVGSTWAGGQVGEGAWIRGPIPSGESSLADAFATVEGNSSWWGTFAGWAVDTWDPDGDGVALVVVAEPGGGYDGSAGRVFLLNATTAGDDVNPDATLSGEGEWDQAGYALAVGDADGDGMDELAVSAPYYQYGSKLGSVYVVGAAGASGGRLASLGLVVRGEKSGDFAGSSLIFADFDGDGLEDLAVAARQANASAGRVDLLRGGGGVTALADAELRIDGAAGEGIASTVGAADLDGDGRPELLLGGSALWGLDASADGVAQASDAATRVEVGGSTVASADLDGDGAADLAWADGGSSGTVRVYYGPLAGVLAEGEEQATISGGAAEAAGASLAFGDPDGDGVMDLLLGASGDATAGADAGAVWIFAGGLAP